MLLLGFAYRTLHLRDLPKVLIEAALTTGSIMLIVASANLLGYVLARERVPQEISQWMLGLTSDATVFLLLVFALVDGAGHGTGRDRRAHADRAHPAADRGCSTTWTRSRSAC